MNDVAAEIPALWRAVGIQLGLSTDVLDGIQTVGASNLTAAYERVFALFFQKIHLRHRPPPPPPKL